VEQRLTGLSRDFYALNPSGKVLCIDEESTSLVVEIRFGRAYDQTA
jgi:hypothetical protein